MCALLGAFVLTFVFLPPGTLSLETIKTHQQSLLSHVEQAPWQSAFFFFALYVLVSALSIPGAAILTLLAGALFALWDWVQRRFTSQMNTVNAGMARDGAGYLFALRLMPLFPFFLVNLLMGLTRIAVSRYWWVSQVAMLPATIIFLNAGRALGKVNSLRDILSPGLIFAFTLLGLLPLATRWLFSRFTPSSKK